MGLSCTIDSSGISAPDFATIFAALQDAYRGIYGADIYLEPDSQDGQLLAIFAQAISDCNSVAIAVFNSFSPATAQGEGLSSVVKINGIARGVPTNSTVDVTVGGQVGLTLPATSFVTDPNDGSNGRWFFNTPVTIGPTGLADVTCTFETPGAVTAASGTLTKIGTPTYGWQTATNNQAATLGAPVETDAQLRVRQGRSTAKPSRTLLEGIIGNLLDLPGVARVGVAENDTSTTDANGVPANTLALVIDGGDATSVASVIAAGKNPGGQLGGTTSVTVTDAYGNNTPIKFYRPTAVTVLVNVSIKAQAGYRTATQAAIQSAVAAYISSLAIGQEVDLSRVNAAALSVGNTFKLDVAAPTLLDRGSGAASADIVLAFYEAATCTTANVTVNVS